MLIAVWFPCACLCLSSGFAFGRAEATNASQETEAPSTLTATPTSSTIKPFHSHVPLIISNLSLSPKSNEIANASSNISSASLPQIRDVLPPSIQLLSSVGHQQQQPQLQPQPQQSQQQKVPLRRSNSDATDTDSSQGAASPSVAAASTASSPTSIFLANYNNQQNVLLLMRNVYDRLRNIRNVEMRVDTIQEIFDAMHFGGLSMGLAAGFSSPQMSLTAIVDHDLQIFSKKLYKKLLRATHVVTELKDFMRKNISSILQQQRHAHFDYGGLDGDDGDEDEDGEDESHEDEGDFYVDGNDYPTNHERHKQNRNLFLNSYIDSCQDGDGNGSKRKVENYNKQQIQILNYLKTDQPNARLYQQHNALSVKANAYIRKKISELKARLAETDCNDARTTPSSPTMTTTATRNSAAANEKLKFVGNHFKHIFFLSHSDHATGLTDRYFGESNFRHLYVSAIQGKFVLLLLDTGAGMADDGLMDLSRSFVSNLLQLLSPSDVVSVVSVADEVQIMRLSEGNPSGIINATRDHKEEALNYINNLVVSSRAATNHTLGFEVAFRLIHRLQNATLVSDQQPVEFVYVTRGLLSNMSDAMGVMQAIANGQRHLQQPIVINTVAVLMDEKRLTHEAQFLMDVASQNYSKYDVSIKDFLDTTAQRKNLVGKFFLLNKQQPEALLQATTAIFGHLFEERYMAEDLTVHEPIVESGSKDALVSFTYAVAPFGVVGVNLYLADLIEDIVSYRRQDQGTNRDAFMYAFLIDGRGQTLAHPAFPRPITFTQTPFPVDIGFLENSTDFLLIRRRILREAEGNASTTVYVSSSRSVDLMQRSYHWQSILSIYILCLVTTTRSPPPTASRGSTSPAAAALKLRLQQLATATPMAANARYNPKVNFPPVEYDYMPSMDLLYHLDLISMANVKLCRHFHQLATLDAATLFLGASAFESPFTFLQNSRLGSPQSQGRDAESIIPYIKDSTGLLANPGLRPQIRSEVNALYIAMQHLKKRHQDMRGGLRANIIRRYIATLSGVLQVYPGCLLSGSYDATRRPWFRKAMTYAGKIVTTAPYLDAGGTGYIVTVAHTIVEGKGSAQHQPVAIVALDVPYSFYYKMLLDSTPLCQAPNMKCLLFDNAGYLVAHPSMMEVSSALTNPRRPHQHVTHKEPFLANDILNHQTLVRKFACANYQHRSLQRYYAFNTSLSEILTNVVHGERTKYAIGLLRDTNIFAAVLNSSYDGTFCPCSKIDRVCLNCNRMDQTDCECPCECPMEAFITDTPPTVRGSMVVNTIESLISNYTAQYSFCEPPSEQFVALPPLSSDKNLLPSCVNINCDNYATHKECLAVMGCEWCQQDLDGNEFTAPFCSSATTCFNGVLSSLTPYGDLDEVDIIAATGYIPSPSQSSYSTFAPIGGAAVVLAIVIGFAIYFYRHNVDSQSQEQFYIDSVQEENYGLPLSRFNFDDCKGHDDPPGAAAGAYDHPAAQRNLINPADISPYHVSTGSSYRRPPNGESDHGYSTMTPHEDSSDHQCFTLAEPLLLNDQRHSKSDTMSISTSISSPTNRYNSSSHHPHGGQPQTRSSGSSSSHSKDASVARYHINSPKKHHHHSSTFTQSPIAGGGRVYEQTTIPLHDAGDETSTAAGGQYILAPVTVHRHMETSES